ncbi:hypothetical protein K458DRAFT_310829 [Lentithecium fluviatile CBS 122367]|uniref:Uncharacterized protein n=1 Tax=Lentithecium fluviatile CBS 122367 TaxID=1168545 RepID=A0A6G1IRQ2_9PLEO|nr:hypothetical protein K458DRAFT_310829 [Lentithecium fluviatile CBS 122367]
MTTRTTTQISSGPPHAQSGRQVTKHWFTRHLKPVPPTWQDKGSKANGELHRRISLQRPRTAPSTQIATMATPIDPPPPLPLTSIRQGTRSEMKVPPRPARPDSGVIRDVNAWLDASKPASPLMGGLSYWRDGEQGFRTREMHDFQYAIPIVREPEGERPATSGSQQLKSFCRRAKKMQVRMPSLKHTRSQRGTVQKAINRRSNSTPLMGIPYEETREGSPPTFLTRFGSARRPATATAATHTAYRGASLGFGQGSVDMPLRRGSPADTRFGGSECSMERHVNAVFGQTTRTRGTLRPVLAAAYIPREDSMGSISDAPTYFTGPPPPSYRSRAASILTTSSFGCIDGMNPEMRQLSQQRAQQKRGMKRKLKRFAQKCVPTK